METIGFTDLEIIYIKNFQSIFKSFSFIEIGSKPKTFFTELVGQPYADWKEERETDPYNNAIFANYSYGITGYKSQGGEWDYIMVDLNTGMRTVPKGYFYTSVTRATKKIIVIPPQKNSF